uniref:Uncharacterized protein n=1 Tax=Meloidogyne enterolobii TaxID=390850 RepID=A0A6V7UC20_MELEN|nr:unnamed protein product [Meloidogyne enterolobii]
MSLLYHYYFSSFPSEKKYTVSVSMKNGRASKNVKREGKVRIHFVDRLIANWTLTYYQKAETRNQDPDPI